MFLFLILSKSCKITQNYVFLTNNLPNLRSIIMNKVSRTKVSIIIISILFILNGVGFGDIRLPRIFGDKMVMQRDMALPVWGWADANESITVTLADNTVQTTANSKGEWKVKMPPMKAGGPFELTVKGKNSVRLTDILIGEVWICSGQSNMEWYLISVKNSQQEVAEANYPQIRIFKVNKQTSGLPLTEFMSRQCWMDTWRICNPENIKYFSAVGYYFGRDLHKKLNVPIGLIDSTWGGTKIEPWTPPQGFAAVDKLQDISKNIEKSNSDYARAIPDALTKLEAWVKDSKKIAAGGEILPPPPWPEHPLNDLGVATSLYNAMINPLVPFAIRGAIWYQGEANCGEGMLYYHKMKALIGGWRAVWGEGDFPFYFVQLAPYKYGGGFSLPEIWQAQTLGLSIPNTGMAVTTDLVDDVANIHPTNKKDVGKRLSLWALAKTYGEKDIVFSGPLYKSIVIEGNSIRVKFDNVGSGLTTRDGKDPDFFEIAGADNKFVNAQAKIDKDTVVVSSPDIGNPAYVRFGWSEQAMPNLMNKDGLPASPFNQALMNDAAISSK
jgi:sialate O-acetylesterase